jgi:superfamily II DNA/RNA helicase
LLDHFERGRLLLTGVELLVIDEADRMLDMGFIPDIERICKLVPFTRQTLFFTATMPPEIRRITEQFLHNPVKVEVSRPATTVATTPQWLVKTGREPHDKRDTLRRLIRSAEGLTNAIIFCNRKREVAALHRSLLRHGFSVIALHGDMDQPARTAALDQFRRNEVTLLVASDVAARGLDIPAVSHIFNFDVPHHPDDYVHRIGRTGRAGRSGTAITIVAPAERKSVASDREADRAEHPLDGPSAAGFRAQRIGRAHPKASSAAAAAAGTRREHPAAREPASAPVTRLDEGGRGSRENPRRARRMRRTAGICRPFCCDQSAPRRELPTGELSAGLGRQFLWGKARRGCPATQTRQPSLRKLDCVPG